MLIQAAPVAVFPLEHAHGGQLESRGGGTSFVGFAADGPKGLALLLPTSDASLLNMGELFRGNEERSKLTHQIPRSQDFVLLTLTSC